MASVNWLKLTPQKAAALSVHFGKSRGKVNHSNEDIDPARTWANSAIGASSYEEAYTRMKERTAAADAVEPPKRVKADRKIAVMLEYPCPAAIRAQGRDEEFFKAAHALYSAFFGPENVHGTFVHRDEAHEYTDRDGTKRESLYHAHTLVSCYVEGKGINCKQFETRARLTELNRAMCEMVRREFGVEYNTGETPRGKTVEALKAEGRAREARNEQKAREAALKADREAARAEDPITPIRRKKPSQGLFGASAGEVTYSWQDAQRLEAALRYAEGSKHMERAADRLESFVAELAAGPQVMAAKGRMVREARSEAEQYKQFFEMLADKAGRYDALRQAYPDQIQSLERTIQRGQTQER